MAERPPFRKILVANRGEIAVRVMRCCRDMGIKSVAVYSDVDREGLHVLEADEAHRLGPAAPRLSYLDMNKILEAAVRSGAEAIHPGYGFLSENSEFAQLCEDQKISFIGPPASAIEAMGDKVAARALMVQAGVSVTPGSDGAVAGEKEIRAVAKRVGYPVLLKPTLGGGGKGMRIVRAATEIASSLQAVRSEVATSFGGSSVFVERYIPRARHIEVQVLAGPDGRTMHLGERECSIQRRHQKLVEECPSPAVGKDLRDRLGEMAVRAAEAVSYRNAGTVEFIMDEKGDVYFMEMNTRLQVEHPVTEMVTGIDLVRAQIRVAAGLDPGFSQDDVLLSGSAIECRIFAEDPENGFLPSPGRLTVYAPPAGPGIREDSGVYAGASVPMDYDPMIAKLIAWGRDRDEAVDRMRRALGDYRIGGVKTTIPFHLALMDHEAFRSGDLHTHFIDEHPLDMSLDHADGLGRAALVAALVTAYDDGPGRTRTADGPPVSPWKQAGMRDAVRRRLPGSRPR